MGKCEQPGRGDRPTVTVPLVEWERLQGEVNTLADCLEVLGKQYRAASAALQRQRGRLRDMERARVVHSTVERVDLDWADDDVVTLVFTESAAGAAEKGS